MKMKNIALAGGVVALGLSMMPGSVSAYHSPNYDADMCLACHTNGVPFPPECIQCHNVTAPPYSVDVAPLKLTHSSAVLYSDPDDSDYGEWARECLDCHNPHHNNGMTKKGGLIKPEYALVTFTGNHIGTVDGVTTMSISDLVINDPTWEDPASWSDKTSAERGLVLLDTISGKTYWYKVVSATDTEISFINTGTYFPMPPWDKDQAMSLVYGQFINDEVNAIPVTFGDYKDMAKDDSGIGFDGSPDGICQVCHTQTAYWRNDGSGADHFNGWRCTICHPHDQGFKAVTPEGCICPEGETCGE